MPVSMWKLLIRLITMNKNIFVSILLFLGLSTGLYAQTASFNFSATSQNIDGWTNLAGKPSTAVIQATSNGITISSVDTTNWAPDYDGNSSANGVGAWPGTFFSPYVMTSDWFQWPGWDFTQGLYNAARPQLQLSGLNKDSTYILRMTGSSAYTNGSTQYTVSGLVNYGNQQVLTYYNTTQGATFQAVKPDVTGHIKVYVNTTSTGGGLISGLQVYPGSAAIGAPAVTILSPSNGTIAAQGTVVTIRATATETAGTIAKVEFFADSIKIGEVDTVPYTFNWVNPDTGHYQLKVRATDGTGTTTTASVTVVVQSLNNLVAADQGLSQTAGGISLGDSIPGSGPHNFRSNRYEYLNGYNYSIGAANDPVNHPAFRVYGNGDLVAGTTMDRSVNTEDQVGMRYYSKIGMFQVGASDRLDTTVNPIVYGPWPSSGIIVNSDVSNTIKGKMMNTFFAGDANTMDTLTRFENVIIASENSHFTTNMGTMISSVLAGYGTYINAPVIDALISGNANQITKPLQYSNINGFVNTTMDITSGSLINGAWNQFGGFSQLVSGQYLVNRTPLGTTLGNSNVDFATLPYTGSQQTNAPNIDQYPLLALGNGANAAGTIRSNALTVLFNGRTQINTSGFTNQLTQANVTPGAALDVVSTNTGVLLPRLTNTQRNAIVAGDLKNGLLLYNTDSSVFQYYNGSVWNSVGAGGSGTGGTKWIFSSGTTGTVYDVSDNVGIGTNDTKGYRLAVNGAAIFNTVKVKPTDLWPDYVFRKGYKLPGLAEVESYIQKYQHLPGVAPAEEVERNGVDVGENQATLLKKVEELTLYVIQLQRQIDELKAMMKKK